MEMKKLNVILEWQMPKEDSIALSKKTLRRGIKVSFITLSIAAVLELVIYLGSVQFPLEELEFSFGRALIFAYLLAVGFCLAYLVIEPFLRRYGKILYQINEKGVLIKSRRLLKWKEITDYYLKDSKSLGGSYIIKYWFLDWERELIVPTREIADEVLKIFDEKVKKKKRKEIIKFKRWQCCFMLTLSLAYSFVLSYLYRVFPNMGHFIGKLLLATMFLGPGTIGMILLFWPKVFKARGGIALAYGFNLLGVASFMFITMAIKYFEFYKIINAT